MAAIACNTFPAVSPLSSSSSSSSSSSTTTTSQVKGRGPICSCQSSNFFIPKFASNSTLKTSRLRISQKISIVPKHVLRVPIVSCLGDNHSEASSETNDSKAEGTVDLKLPRRSLLVHFTCNACGERTQKLINRLAYERGTVFVQCAGCFQHHKLIDNLGLVVEYDFREDSGMDSNADRV